MKFQRVPRAASFTTVDSALQGRLTDSRREFAAAMSVCHLASCLARPAPFRRPGLSRNWFKRKMPMILVLVMAFNISVALALGFVIGRIYQMRSDELERRVKPPRTAYIPSP